jgi:O-antigen ligase
MSQKNKSEGVFNIMLWAFVALMPFVQINSVIDTTLVPRQLFLAAFLVLVSLVGYGTARTKGQQQWGFTQVAMLAFFVFQCVAYAFAANTAEAAATISRYAGYVGYFMLIITLLRYQLLQLQSIVKAFVVLGAIAAVLAGIELLRALSSGKFWQDVYVIKATFGHKNILSGILMLSLPFYLMLSNSKERIWARLSLVMFFITLLEIFMLRTRGVWLATVVGSIAVLGLYFAFLKSREGAPRLKMKWVALGLLCSIGIGGALLTNKQVSVQVADGSNISRRAVFWNNSLQMIQEDWLTGVGPGNWKVAFPKYGLEKMDISVQEGVTNIQRPHNDYLWVWSEGGTLSFIAYLLVFITALALGVRLVKQQAVDYAWMATLAMGGIIAYMLFSFGDFPLERTIPVVMLLTLIAILVHKEEGGLVAVKGNIAFAIPLLLAGISLIVGYYRLQGEKDAVIVLQANAARNAPQLVDVSLNAVNPFFNMDNYANPIPYFTGTGYAAQQKFDMARTELETALEMHPNHILSLNTLANTYRALGNPQAAEPFYKKSLAIAPLNPRTRVAACDLYVQLGKYTEAFEMLTLVQDSYQDPRYKQLIVQVVKYFYDNFEQEQQYPKMIRFLRARNPQTPEDFYRGFMELKQRGVTSG